MKDLTVTPPTLEALCQRRDEIMRLMEQYGAYNVRVFGSVARGEAGPDSDIDFLVSFPPNKSMFELVGLWLDLQELLGRDVSLLTDHDGMRERLHKNVIQDAVAL
jgi:predicted nucleotidyltransferase